MTKYGNGRDDIPIYLLIIKPPSTQYVRVEGRFRDVIDIINKLDYKILQGGIKLDEFLEEYHRSDSEGEA